MKTIYKLLVIIITITTISCKQPQARKPINNTSHSSIELSIQQNKTLYAAEEQLIEQLIAATGDPYQQSQNGFYYHFTHKDSIDGAKPKFGDRVTFEYNVIALNGDTIYNTQDLSPITKSIDQEYGLFPGMREALKLMQKDEQATFYFPSYAGYGYYGDNNRIGTNVPFKSDVKILSIN